MAKFDNDDLDFLGGDGPGSGGRLIGLLFMLLGTVIFSAAMVAMLYETEQGLASHDMHNFFTRFGLALIIGLPIFIGGIWLFNRGRRRWNGEESP
jgi:hypothetical protein